ncbi:MAG TPA: hypothetical protein VGL93_33040, partial [Streptosporangiaceae bacterium]
MAADGPVRPAGSRPLRRRPKELAEEPAVYVPSGDGLVRDDRGGGGSGTRPGSRTGSAGAAAGRTGPDGEAGETGTGSGGGDAASEVATADL